MKWFRTGVDRNVWIGILRYRVFLPYGRVSSRSVYTALLNYEKKALVNTGVIENLNDLEGLFQDAGVRMEDLSMVWNLSARPESMGLNAVLETKQTSIEFLAHPEDVPYIEDTVVQHESRYVPGFYKLVAGNTRNIRGVADGASFDLGGEQLLAVHHDRLDSAEGSLSLYLPKSGLMLGSDEMTRMKKPLTDRPFSTAGQFQVA